MIDSAMDQTPHRQFFARRIGRPLRDTAKERLSHVLPQIAFDSNDPFPSKGTTRIFEFGFGKGEAMLHRLALDPNASFIASEVFQNSLASFAKDLPEKDFNRVRIHADDGFPLLDQLPKNSLDEFWLLNPDPWHKKRHYKRRFVQRARLDQVAKLLRPGGVFFTTTDVPYLAGWTVEHLINHPSFQWSARSKNDWRMPPPDWKQTAYETKGAKGSTEMVYLSFQKR